MQTSLLRFLIMLICMIVTVSSCAVYQDGHYGAGNSGKIPPGQAKKMAGAQSARDFAPGHNK